MESQMPLPPNESQAYSTMTFTGQDTFIKENYWLSRERVTEKGVSFKTEFFLMAKLKE